MATALDVLTKFAPAANASYRKAFEQGGALLTHHGITTPLRIAHFMAQCFQETGAFQTLVESGSYSAKNLGDMWDSGNWHKYFADRAACVEMAAQCKVDRGVALFSLVYGKRMGNGAPATQDGWTYRGRGVLQTTGRASYRKFGDLCGVDFEGHPDLVVDPAHALKPALFEWTANALNAAADRNDIEAITRGINGGLVGFKGRKAWFAQIWPFVIGAPPPVHTTEWRVQAALVLHGYDCGNPDGNIGQRSRDAILAYCAANGLALSFNITPKLRASLGVA